MATETGFIQFQEQTAPSTPASTKWRLYFKTTGLFVIDDAGTEIGPIAADGSAAHIADATDAHDASAISFSPTGTIAATDVQTAIAEVASEAGSGGSLPWVIPPIYGMARSADGTIGAANRAVVIPVWIPADCTITGVRLKIANSTGNGDVGLYDSSLGRLASHGGAAWAGTGIQTISFGTPYAATAGRYYLAMAASSNTASFAIVGGSTSGPINCKFMETAYPLPSTFVSAGETSFNPAAAGIISGISY